MARTSLKSARWARNNALIVLLIRDGMVKTVSDLVAYFGLKEFHATTDEAMIRHYIFQALRELEDAGMIERQPTDLSGERDESLHVTPLLEKVQSSLQLSLSALASGVPNTRLVISPQYTTDEATRYESDIFVLMPFSQALTAVYQDHLRSVAQALQMTMARADDFFTSEQIMTEVWSAIVRAKIVIADCTGRNPNVFYEIGLSHALGKPVVLITQVPEDVPFDLRQYRYLVYEFTPRGMKVFEEALTKTLKTILEVEEVGFRELRPF